MLEELKETVRFIQENDPAAKSELEVLICYSGLHAIYLHKLSHWLYKQDCFLLARLISNLGRFLTGIEIHPGAQIAKKVFIDHGLGVVIGETAEIGQEVIIYQGVTLGGTHSQHIKRHPTVQSGVVIGAHAQVLGNIIIGQNSRIGSGSVVVKDVEPETTVVGIPARSTNISKGENLNHQEIPDILFNYIDIC